MASKITSQKLKNRNHIFLMPNTINNHNITINVPVEKVWEVLTTSNGITKYLPNIKVVSDWKIGSSVVYTCYEDEGNTITTWNNQEMVWNGIITELETNKIYSVDYNGSCGIIKETYTLKSQEGSTDLSFYQECVDEEIAKGYNKGNGYTQLAIKKYFEN